MRLPTIVGISGISCCVVIHLLYAFWVFCVTATAVRSLRVPNPSWVPSRVLIPYPGISYSPTTENTVITPLSITRVIFEIEGDATTELSTPL